MFDSADDPGAGHGQRVHLDRVLSGLRHLEASYEPARVFAGLAQVCVPALCDECVIEVIEQGTRPYRIRRLRPGVAPGLASGGLPSDSLAIDDLPAGRPGSTREASECAVAGEPDPLGVTVTIDDSWVRARFAPSPGSGPPFQGVVACRWDGGYLPAPSDRTLVGVLVDHALALVQRDRVALAGTPTAPEGVGLPMQHRIAAASGILMSLYHLSPEEARHLLTRAGSRISTSVGDIADTVLRTGALPLPDAPPASDDGTGRQEPGPMGAS